MVFPWQHILYEKCWWTQWSERSEDFYLENHSLAARAYDDDLRGQISQNLGHNWNMKDRNSRCIHTFTRRATYRERRSRVKHVLVVSDMKNIKMNFSGKNSNNLKQQTNEFSPSFLRRISLSGAKPPRKMCLHQVPPPRPSRFCSTYSGHIRYWYAITSLAIAFSWWITAARHCL